jgi:hypothetical protein
MNATQLIDQVHAEAREYHPLRAVLFVAAAIPFLIGLVIGSVVRALWFACAWMFAAGKVGYRTARGKGDGHR